jgi:ankyrin repeat protein
MEISDLPVLHLAGEDEDETELIAKEIDLVIAARIKELSLRLDLSTDDAEHLRIRLSGFNNRTYLWVHLTMNVIENADRTSRGGISSIIEQLPKSVYDAYEKILDRSSDSLRARKLLEIMLAATRPLGLFEIAIALDINEAHKTHLELEVPPEHKVVRYLRDLCGLFIVVINAEIFFLHQTAREFLMRDEEKPSLGASKKQTPSSITQNNSMDSELWNWAHTITRKEAHRTLGKLCVAYLLLRDFIDDTTLGRKHHVESPRSIQEGIAFPFLQYASRNWYLHCREAGFDSNLTGPMMQLCGYSGGWGCDSGPTSMAWTYEHNEEDMKIRRLSPLMIAARFGVTPVARSILTDRPYAAKEVDTRTGRSALSFSSEQGFIDIVELLLTYLYSRVRRSMGLTRKHVDNIAKSGQTPLSFAALNGHTTVARLLLKCGARAEHKDIFNGTPLSYGLCSEDEAMVALVLNGSEAMGPKDLDDTLLTILCYALVRDQGRIITRMIGTNRVEATAMLSLEFVNDTTVALDRFAVSLMSDQELSGPRTVKLKPFTVAELAVCVASRTFFRAFEAIGKAVDVRHSDQWGTTLLHWAAVHTQASDGILEDLVSKGALIDAMEDRAGCTPLHWALWARKSDTAELLLSFGADVHKRSQDGRSAFKMGNWSHTAAFMLCGNVSIPGLENIHGADRSRLKDFIIVERDGNPSRMFDFAFLERSRYWDAAFDQNPDFGLSNLIAVVASLKGEYDVLESLVRGGVSLQFQNIQGQTLLHERQSIRQASLLLDHPIDPNIQDDQGRTALHEVISRGSHLWSTLDLDMVTLLLNHGASPNIQDHSGAAALHEVLRCRLSRDQPAQTALRERAHCLEIVKLLLDNSAYVDLQDGEGRSALHIAASCGVAPVVIRLLEAYADVGLSDDKGNTPLHYALSNGHQDVGDVLLGSGASLGMLNDAGEPPIAHGVGYGKSGKFRLRKRVDGLRGS